MSTYVINNRIPRFPLKTHYVERSQYQKQLEDIFQVWLKEVFVSNLLRRKACSQLYDFSCTMDDENLVVEKSQAKDFLNWCEALGTPPLLSWGDFLVHAKKRLPSLEWEE